MTELAPRISHADMDYTSPLVIPSGDILEEYPGQLRHTWRARTFIETAKANIEHTHPNHPRTVELAERLAGLLATERSRRNAHYYRYRAMLKIANGEPLFTARPENIPEASLSDFYTRVAAMEDADFEYAQVLGGKGISAELGHVDQLGDWQAGKVLDEAIRQLPRSQALADEGFLFGNTFDAKQNARLNYNFHLVDSARGIKGVSIKGVRKRAAADILTEDGSIFELVKQSTFLIDVQELDRPQRASLGRTLKLQSLSDEMKKQRTDKSELQKVNDLLCESTFRAGDQIIEPFIGDRELRDRSTAVLAATSLYFALYRHQ